NGGAFGGKESSPVPAAARALADRLGRAVRVVFSREDVVRLGPKRPPIGAAAVYEGDAVDVQGRVVDGATAFSDAAITPYRLDVRQQWEAVPVARPPVSTHVRAAGLAEVAVFAAVAAAAWNAVTRAEGARPERFPARGTRAARRLRR